MSGKQILGGLLVGVGEGVQKRGASRTAAIAAMREEALSEARRQEDRQWEQEDAAASAAATAGQVQSTGVDESGDAYAVTKGGETKGLGIRPMLKEGDTGSKGGRGTLKTADLSLIQIASSKYWGSMDANNQWVVSADARDNYTTTMERAEKLANNGVPIGKAIRIAAQSISGVIDEDKARKLADIEANEAVPGWTMGDEREAYSNKRVTEIISESKSAEREFERLTSAGGKGAETPKPTDSPKKDGGTQEKPAGAGTQASPYTAKLQSDINWFNKNAAIGDIIEIDGELYAKE